MAPAQPLSPVSISPRPSVTVTRRGTTEVVVHRRPSSLKRRWWTPVSAVVRSVPVWTAGTPITSGTTVGTKISSSWTGRAPLSSHVGTSPRGSAGRTSSIVHVGGKRRPTPHPGMVSRSPVLDGCCVQVSASHIIAMGPSIAITIPISIPTVTVGSIPEGRIVASLPALGRPGARSVSALSFLAGDGGAALSRGGSISVPISTGRTLLAGIPGRSSAAAMVMMVSIAIAITATITVTTIPVPPAVPVAASIPGAVAALFVAARGRRA
mmetsp:Transcript_14421/g.33445  ORF Transcript_14421/g.33445 Transcript_14421/m.33445 type:complete len:267 (-) Transcript_14421:1610-2410(-)